MDKYITGCELLSFEQRLTLCELLGYPEWATDGSGPAVICIDAAGNATVSYWYIPSMHDNTHTWIRYARNTGGRTPRITARRWLDEHETT